MARENGIEQDDQTNEQGTLEKADVQNVQGAGQSGDQDLNAKEADKQAEAKPVGRGSDTGWWDEEAQNADVPTQQVETSPVPTAQIEGERIANADASKTSQDLPPIEQDEGNSKSVIFGQELDKPEAAPAPAVTGTTQSNEAQDVSKLPEVRSEQERVNSTEFASLGEKSSPQIRGEEQEKSQGRGA